MLKTIFITLLSLLGLLTGGSDPSSAERKDKGRDHDNGTLEKMIVTDGSVAMELDLKQLTGFAKGARSSKLSFNAGNDAFFTVVVFNDELRGPLPSSMPLIPMETPGVAAKLNAAYKDLAVESTEPGSEYELIVRDTKTGFVFFNIEGSQFEYKAKERLLSITGGRLLVTKEFAAELGRPRTAGSSVGTISIEVTMRTIETAQVANGEVISSQMPPMDWPQA